MILYLYRPPVIRDTLISKNQDGQIPTVGGRDCISSALGFPSYQLSSWYPPRIYLSNASSRQTLASIENEWRRRVSLEFLQFCYKTTNLTLLFKKCLYRFHVKCGNMCAVIAIYFIVGWRHWMSDAHQSGLYAPEVSMRVRRGWEANKSWPFTTVDMLWGRVKKFFRNSKKTCS